MNKQLPAVQILYVISYPYIQAGGKTTYHTCFSKYKTTNEVISNV